MKDFEIQGRKIGPDFPPLVIAEVGINHEGEYAKAIALVDAAAAAGAECIKFQSHIAGAEMIPTDIKPGKISEERLWDIIQRCELTEEEESRIKTYAEKKGLLYLCTPFSREAADRLERIGVSAFKIGSGECNNLPLLDHIARKGKPVILSTGMNDLASIHKSIRVFKKHDVPFMLMHCVSIYPAPYEKLRLNAIVQMRKEFKVPIGLSDHSLGIYTCLGAVALGASALEKHFTISRAWPGPDNPFSIEPAELKDLVVGSRAVWQALRGEKEIQKEERPVIEFAYASVVSIRDIKKGEILSRDNIWVKRPGTGEILVDRFDEVLGKKAKVDISNDRQLTWDMIDD
jgi:N-acetylneuraminate synthase